jgi:hypothetical protein
MTWIRITALWAGVCLSASAAWQTSAKWERPLHPSLGGTIVVDREGVKFQTARGVWDWSYENIRTLDLSPRELVVVGYENRRWNTPGQRSYYFRLSQPMPPDVASQLTTRVGKPSRNGLPEPESSALAVIPAHRRARFGGSNGILRLKTDGIDFVSADGRHSGAWRWADLQTLANPDPYELRLTGYREIVAFDLKTPLHRAIFETLWDRLYAEAGQ